MDSYDLFFELRDTEICLYLFDFPLLPRVNDIFELTPFFEEIVENSPHLDKDKLEFLENIEFLKVESVTFSKYHTGKIMFVLNCTFGISEM